MKNAISKVKTVRSFRVVPKCRQDFDVDIEGCAEDVRQETFREKCSFHQLTGFRLMEYSLKPFKYMDEYITNILSKRRP